MSHDVFISYSQADKPAADAVCHRLEDAGIRCWIAPRDIGDDRGRNSAVVQAVGESRLAVVIFSEPANTSLDMLDEVAVVLDAEVTVIPFRVEDIERSGGSSRRLHWLDALNEPLNVHIDRLIDRVRYNLSPASPAGDAGEPQRIAAAPATLDAPAMPPPLVPAMPPPLEPARPPFIESAMPPLEAARPPFTELAMPPLEPARPPSMESAMPPPLEPARVPFMETATPRPIERARPRRFGLAVIAALAVAAIVSVLVLLNFHTTLFAPRNPPSGQQAAVAPAPAAAPAPPPAAQPAPALEPKPPELKPTEPAAAEPKSAPAPLPPVTTPRALTVAGNSEAAPIDIPAPTDPDYPAAELSITVTALPSNGTVVMSNKATPVAAGQTLTSAELAGLMFIPGRDVFDSSSAVTYTVKNPVGLSAEGSVSLTIGAKPAELTPADDVAKGMAAFDRGDYAEALRWYRTAADQGNADAQVDIGVLYGLGLGVKRDYDEALRWYRMAADQGNAQGQKNVGLFFQNGWGVKQDYAEAMRWLRKAADQGDARAQASIGYLFDSGHGVTRDYAKAMRWYRKAADQGDAGAQARIGRLYDKGLGVEQDYAEAMRWLRKAADQGDAKAQASIGYLYETGRGVTRDYDESMRWFRLAADKGNPQAQSNIGALYANGWGVERDPAQARAWMEKAAAGGDAYAKRWLADH